MKSQRSRFALIATVLSSVALSACGISPMVRNIFTATPDSGAPRNREIQVTLRANSQSNLSPTGQAQPVKVCLIELHQENWLPPQLGQGLPCTGISNGAGVLSHQILTMPPGSSHTQSFSVPHKEKRYFIVGAEFQQTNANRPIYTITSQENKSEKFGVAISARGLVPFFIDN